MTLYTVQFDYERSDAYARLLAVFERSCAINMPGVRFEAVTIHAPATKIDRRTGHTSNVHKLRAWDGIVERATEPVILADCDMLCLRSIEDAFDGGDWDIAYTARTNPRLPLNGGLLFVRPTRQARRFFERWVVIDKRMYEDADFHRPWLLKTCGMNQASFWYLRSEEPEIARLGVLPCAEWNACLEDWQHIGPQTRMVHIKGQLRDAVLSGKAISEMPPMWREAARKWREYERR